MFRYYQQRKHLDSEIIFDEITLSNDVVTAVLRLLTETAFQIAPSLFALFNKSLSRGVLPDDWKLANVVPVHKRGEKSHVENYRPISPILLLQYQISYIPTNQFLSTWICTRKILLKYSNR